MTSSIFLSSLKAGLFHFLISLGVAAIFAVLVFYIWYPWPYYEMIGGRELFLLIIAVDVVCGPLLTMTLWNPAKPRRELFLDLSLVGIIQIVALVYGLYIMSVARPIYIVYELDRLRVIAVTDINEDELPQALPALRQLPWFGPQLISIREAKDSDELMKSVDLSFAGQEPSQRPGWWQAYELGLPQLLKRARPVAALALARPEQKALLYEAVRKAGLPEADLVWLPLTSTRAMEWVVLLDKTTGQPRAYAPIEGFF